MPPARLVALHKAAEALGVTVLRLDANRNRLFEPMAKGQPMSETQSMMDATMSSPSVMGATMMMVPEASQVEAALTRGMRDRAPARAGHADRSRSARLRTSACAARARQVGRRLRLARRGRGHR